MSIVKSISRTLLIVTLLLAQMLPAPAAIIFAGGEDIDFAIVGAAGPLTTAGLFRAAWARDAMWVTATGGNDPAINFWQTPTVGNQTTMWIHFVFNSLGFNGTTSNVPILAVYGSDGVRRLYLRGTGNAGQIKISKRTAANAYTDLVTCTAGAFPSAANATTKYDFFINYAVAGHVTFWQNGVNVCDFAGDVTTDGVTAINQVQFAAINNQPTATNWSEIILATTDTRDMNLFTCSPTANGTTQNWTGTASSVNPVSYNDGTAITTTSSNTIGNFTCPSLPAGAYTVPAIVQSARVQGFTGTLTNFRFNSRPGGAGSDFDTTADIPAAANFASYPGNVVPTNPATSGAWTTSAVSSGNFGIKSRP